MKLTLTKLTQDADIELLSDLIRSDEVELMFHNKLFQYKHVRYAGKDNECLYLGNERIWSLDGDLNNRHDMERFYYSRLEKTLVMLFSRRINDVSSWAMEDGFWMTSTRTRSMGENDLDLTKLITK